MSIFDYFMGGDTSGRGGDTGGRKQDYSQPNALSPQAAQNQNQPFDWHSFIDEINKQHNQPVQQQMQQQPQDIYASIRGGGQLMNMGAMMNPMSKFMGK